jgi:hydrogenase-4 component E
MTPETAAQLIALATGLLLLTAVLQLWLRSVMGPVALLVVQGFALAGLVATIAVAEGEWEALAMAAVILVLKAGFLPWALVRTATATRVHDGLDPGARPALGLLASVLLTTVAYLVSQPLIGPEPTAATSAVPVGIALVLLGFLILLTRHIAVSQLVGFLVLDNGIAATGFLLSGGLPLTTEIGVLVDVLLVVLILRVLTVRMVTLTGGTSLADLRELSD